MITFQHPDHTAPAPAGIESIETDPVHIIARAMIELDACGHTVTIDALCERTKLARKTILANEDDARDEANRQVLERGHYRRVA